MNISSRTKGLVIILLSSIPFLLFAQGEDEDWRERMKLLTYTPRYFGPNAFPISELRSGRIGTRWELELRGEYHYYPGDKTSDLFARLFIPIAHGKAGVEIAGVITENYETTEATKLERRAAETKPPFRCYGDVLIHSFYQVLRSDRWCDLMVSANLKTASGSRLADARYTDAASYWFDLTAGRNLLQNADESAALRVQGLLGFYCWMTNDLVHRQNDALLYGIGMSAKLHHVSLSADYSGFYGYKNNGDHPVTLCTKFEYEIKKNIISVRFKHGMYDNLYDSYSLAYIRCF